jgi:hypothetical protein
MCFAADVAIFAAAISAVAISAATSTATNAARR